MSASFQQHADGFGNLRICHVVTRNLLLVYSKYRDKSTDVVDKTKIYCAYRQRQQRKQIIEQLPTFAVFHSLSDWFNAKKF